MAGLPSPVAAGMADGLTTYSTRICIKLLRDVPGQQEHVEPQAAEVWGGSLLLPGTG